MSDPECWCAYGGEGREADHPQCPTHGSEPALAPSALDDERMACNVCEDGWVDCSWCEGGGEGEYGDRCPDCGGRGELIPDHCCACGGMPYCQCCRQCGAPYSGSCGCKIPVQMSDGTVKAF